MASECQDRWCGEKPAREPNRVAAGNSSGGDVCGSCVALLLCHSKHFPIPGTSVHGHSLRWDLHNWGTWYDGESAAWSTCW